MLSPPVRAKTAVGGCLFHVHGVASLCCGREPAEKIFNALFSVEKVSVDFDGLGHRPLGNSVDFVSCRLFCYVDCFCHNAGDFSSGYALSYEFSNEIVRHFIHLQITANGNLDIILHLLAVVVKNIFTFDGKKLLYTQSKQCYTSLEVILCFTISGLSWAA